ncbi:hypothetical protein MKW92_000188 [Papaver armeniacum]|nr:hypothetical protein MKW92_000188 [Papaver armeniacum]
MVPESIYDSEFRTHRTSAREFDIGKHIIDRHRLIPILKEEIDDPKFFYHTRETFRSRTRKMNGPDSSPTQCTTIGPTRQHLPTQARSEIGRIRHKYEIPMRIGIDVEEASFNAPQDNGAIFWGGSRASNAKRPFIPLFRQWHTPPTSTPFTGTRNRGSDKKVRKLPSVSTLGPSLFLCAAVRRGEFYDRLSSRETHWPVSPLKDHDLIRICYVASHRNTKRLTHFLQSAEPLSAGSTAIAARSTVEFPRAVIREVPHSKQVSPIQFLRERESVSRVKHRKSLPIKEPTRGMSGRRSLLDAVQLAETLGAGVEVPSGRSLTIGHECNDPVVIVYSEGGGKKGTQAGSFKDGIPHLR